MDLGRIIATDAIIGLSDSVELLLKTEVGT